MSNPADDILRGFGLPTSTEPGYTKGPRSISSPTASRYGLDHGGRSRRRRAHRARRSRKAMKAGKRSRRAARRASRR